MLKPKEQGTLCICKWVSFDCHIIFQKAFPIGPYAGDGPDGALYSISSNSYMDSELFMVSSRSSLSQTQNIEGPKLLILNGLRSPLSTDLIDLFRRNNIHMYCLLPQTQPYFANIGCGQISSIKTT